MEMVLSSVVPTLVEKLLSLIESEARLLSGATTELRKLERKLEVIKEVIEDAEGKQLRDASVRRWLVDLKQVVYDVDDLVDDCRLKAAKMAMHQGHHQCYVSLLACIIGIPFRHEMGVRVGSINARLEEMHKLRLELQLTSSPLGGGFHQNVDVTGATRRFSNRETSPSVLESDIVGMDEDVDQLVKWLVEVNDVARTPATVDVITGMGGIGKTTLAQKVFNRDKIDAHFDVKVWVCVSQNFSQVNLLKQIIRSVGGICGEAQTKTELDLKLKETISEKRFLLVLDDVWDVQVWEDVLRRPLLNTTGIGSKILVTTRNEQIARQMRAMHHHKMRLMSDKDCWSMLCKIVFEDETRDENMETLRSTGLRIINRCRGLPLAVKAIGGVLRKRLRNKREWERIIADEIWNSKELPEGVLDALYLSYVELPSPLKQCFVFCSLFPEDYEIRLFDIKQLWIAEGFVKATGQSDMDHIATEYYWELIERGLFQVLSNDYDMEYFKMHDLVRSLACFLAKDECLSEDAQLVNAKDLQTRHLSMMNTENVKIPHGIKKQGCLRTLLLSGSQVHGNLFDDIFSRLVYLRVLDLSKTGIQILPRSIAKLVHLKFLNISSTFLKELPESICCLRNLLMLNVSGCTFLSKLPKGISSLTNLRDLSIRNTSLDYMPQEIKRLTDLRRLDGFVMGPRDVPERQEFGCTITELKHLSKLHYLHIVKLQRMSITTSATHVAALREITNLRTLVLSCNIIYITHQPTEDSISRIEQVVEQLYPPQCLEELIINGFYGRKLPTWTSGSSLPRLTRLRIGQAFSIKAIENVSSIEKLEIIGMPYLKRISNLYNLENLEISECSALEEVENVSTLKYVKIHDNKMHDLPNWIQHNGSIQSLYISGNRELIQNCQEGGKDWAKIKHIPHIIYKPFYFK